MGYYIDFLFPADQKLTQSEIVARFQSEGAIISPYSSEESEGDGRSQIDLLFDIPPVTFLIVVFPEKRNNGKWACARISWGTNSTDFNKTINIIIELSQRIGCLAYDGQTGKYLTDDNLVRSSEEFNQGSSMIKKMIGFVDNNKLKS